MINLSILRKNSGVTLIELLIVVTIIGILALIGIPQYGQFVSKNKVKRTANELLQNMRLARTMAIKENRAYMIVFNQDTNNYRIGTDVNGDGDIFDDEDEYGNGAEVREIDLRTEYGENVMLGSGNFTTVPPNGPNGAAIADAVSFQFNPDGSANPNGTVYFQYDAADRGYSYCVELANATGLTNLFMWDGDASDANKNNPTWTEVR